MMKKSIVIISLVIVLFSCTDNKLKQENSRKQENNIEKLTKERENIDTISLESFWIGFQKNIVANNRGEIIEISRYPIHAIHPVMFSYAYHCDTRRFIEEEDKYQNLDIDKNNINKYYDLIFSDVMIEVISKTSVQRLIEEGINNEIKEGISFVFFFK